MVVVRATSRASATYVVAPAALAGVLALAILVGLLLLIAAAVVHPDKPIISVSGDSAIGLSGMEMETVCRYLTTRSRT